MSVPPNLAPFDLGEEYRVPHEQIEQYKRDGHLYLPRVLMKETLDYFRPFFRQIMDQQNKQVRKWDERDLEGKKESITVKYLHRYSVGVIPFILARRLGKIAADLLETDSVRMLGNYGVYKEPGDKSTRWHQDNNHIFLDTDRTLTIWIPLTDITRQMGTMVFLSGSHSLNDREKGDVKNLAHAIRKGLPEVNYGAMQAGDVTVHSGWTLHTALSNTSEQTREVVTLMYFADGARFLSHDKMKELPRSIHLARPELEIKAGEVAKGPDYPIVYQRM